MIASSRTYSIGMVHFQIGGGWKVILIVLAGYLALFAGGLGILFYADYWATTRGEPAHSVSKSIGPGIVSFLMGIQGLVLLLAGGYRVSSSIRHDISSRMLESHRLMPVSSPNAVLGYLFGPTSPAVAFALLNVLLSCAFGASVGGALPRLALNQGIIFAFAVFTWSLIALGTLIYRHIFFVALAASFLGICTGLVLYGSAVIPPFAMLLTPFMGETIFSMGGAGRNFDAGYVIGIAGQAVLFLVFFAGACRLYRGTYATAFSSRLAMILLLTWSVLSFLGLEYSNRLGLTELFRGNGEFVEGLGTAQIIASFTTCLIISTLLLWSFIQEERRAKSRLPLRAAMILVTAILVAAPTWGAQWKAAYSVQNHIITVLVALPQVLVAYSLLRLLRSIKFIFAFLITAAVALIFWVGPLILEIIRVTWIQPYGDNPDHLSILAGMSPPGLLAGIWQNVDDVPVVASLIFQWLVSLAIVAGAFALIRRADKHPPAQGTSSPAPALTAPAPPLASA